MYNKTFFKTKFLIIFAVILSSCSSYNNMTIGVTQPAPVFVPKEITKVGIINRAIPKDVENKILEGIEKILTLDSRDIERQGSEQALKGLFNGLIEQGKFETIKIIENHNLQTPSNGVLPVLLSWSQIDKLCKENNVDAILELSFYDTDASFSFDAIPVKINGPLGTTINLIEHELSINTIISIGLRLYDYNSNILRDEYIVREHQISKGRGINPLNAYKTIMGRKESILHLSSIMGNDYIYRLQPYSTRVSRIYYVRGTNNFKIAKRRAQVGDWDGAAELWKNEINNKNRKIAGRAHHNMAIINEINGDLESAISWASKAYVDYKNEKSLRYLNILKNRVSELIIIETQKN